MWQETPASGGTALRADGGYTPHLPLSFSSDSLGTAPRTQRSLLDIAPLGEEPLQSILCDREATLLRHLSKSDDGDAAYELGMLYVGRANVPAAMRYLEMAHDLGKREAAYALASLILARNELRDRLQHRGELEKARALLEHADRGGDGRARQNLALVMHWLDPSNAQLKERVHRIFGEPARAAEQRQDELDLIQDICERGDADRAEELARLKTAHKAAKRERERANAERSLAKTAAHVQEQRRTREETRRFDAATPQNPDDTFYAEFNQMVSEQGADASPGASEVASRSPQYPRYMSLNIMSLDIFGDHTGSADETAESGDESEPDLLGTDTSRAPDPSHGETASPAPRDDSRTPEPDPSHGETASPAPRDDSRFPDPCHGDQATESLPRDSSPSPGSIEPEKKKRGRPLGCKDSKQRAAYGSKVKKAKSKVSKASKAGPNPKSKTGRGTGRPGQIEPEKKKVGRPKGTKDLVPRKRKTKAEVERAARGREDSDASTSPGFEGSESDASACGA